MLLRLILSCVVVFCCCYLFIMKEVLYEVRCLKSTEDMILALAGQFKQLSHEDNCLNCPASARIISSVDFKHRTSYNTSFILHSFHGKT